MAAESRRRDRRSEAAPGGSRGDAAGDPGPEAGEAPARKRVKRRVRVKKADKDGGRNKSQKERRKDDGESAGSDDSDSESSSDSGDLPFNPAIFNPWLMMNGMGMMGGMPNLPGMMNWQPTSGAAGAGGAGARPRSRTPEPGTVTETMTIPRGVMGRVIGKAGGTINKIREEAGCRIDAEDKTEERCDFKLVGQPEAIEKARALIQQVVDKAQGSTAAGGDAAGGDQDDDEEKQTETLEFPLTSMGGIIGAKGVKISEVRQTSGARIQVDKELTTNMCRVHMTGTPTQLENARKQILQLATEDQSATGAEVAEGPEETMEFPVASTGRIIGSRGASVAEVRNQTGAKVSVKKGEDVCRVMISGTPEQIEKAKKMVIALAQDGGREAGILPRGGNEEKIEVPLTLVGRIIGKGGEVVKRLQEESGARIDVNSQSGDPCLVKVSGRTENVNRAKDLIADVLDRWATAADRAVGTWSRGLSAEPWKQQQQQQHRGDQPQQPWNAAGRFGQPQMAGCGGWGPAMANGWQAAQWAQMAQMAGMGGAHAEADIDPDEL